MSKSRAHIPARSTALGGWLLGNRQSSLQGQGFPSSVRSEGWVWEQLLSFGLRISGFETLRWMGRSAVPFDWLPFLCRSLIGAVAGPPFRRALPNFPVTGPVPPLPAVEMGCSKTMPMAQKLCQTFPKKGLLIFMLFHHLYVKWIKKNSNLVQKTERWRNLKESTSYKEQKHQNAKLGGC